MRPPIRLAALMGLHVVHVFTHDSIALGRTAPRSAGRQFGRAPGDSAAHGDSVRPMPTRPPSPGGSRSRPRAVPYCLVLTGKAVPTLDRSRYASGGGPARGAYVLSDPPSAKPDVILIASGSEVGLIVAGRGAGCRAGSRRHACVSMPSWDLFEACPQSERDAVLPRRSARAWAVEMGSRRAAALTSARRGSVLSHRSGFVRLRTGGTCCCPNHGFTVEECAPGVALRR